MGSLSRFRNDEIPIEAGQSEQLVGGSFPGRNVAVLGAAFKPDSDDVRDSPALDVAAMIQLRGGQVRVHDPAAIDNARACFPTLEYVATSRRPASRQTSCCT
jgi:UDP-glucose 6-dehydrogenase